MDWYFSPHFRNGMVRSTNAARLGIDNTPGPQEAANLARLALTVAEPIRALIGMMLETSGYRCPAVNTEAKGSGWKPGQKPSAHMAGRALDFYPHEMPLQEAFDTIRAHPEIPWDKVLIEYGQWIHIQVADRDEAPKHEAYVVTGTADDPVYTPVL